MNLSDLWKAVRSVYKNTRLTHNFFTFLGFVCLAALFWFVLAMNDNMQESVEARLSITGIPDTVTFINLPPAKLHVSVRDKGTTLMRTSMFQTPTIELNFRDFAQDGVFHVSATDFQSALKHTFGQSSTITGSSLDSLRLLYTGNPARRVPVDVDLDVQARSGMTIGRKVICEPEYVRLYSVGSLDTIHKVMTDKIIKRDLQDNIEVFVKLKPIPGVRMIPDNVKVRIPVEPLVKREQMVNIQTNNVPPGYDLLLFPQNVKVVYYVPMSLFSSDSPKIDVRVDYNEISENDQRRLPLHLIHVPSYLHNVELKESDVEYTIVKE